RNLLVNDAGDYETLVQQLPTANELNVNLPADPVNPFTVADTMQLTRANAKALGVSPNSLPGIRSEFNPDPRNTVLRDGRITVNSDPNLWDFQRRNGLLTYREDFVTVFLRELGEILGFTSSLDTISAALDDTRFNRDIQITPLDLFRFAPGQAQDDFRQATRLLNPLVPDHVFYAGGQFDPTALGLPIAGLATGEIPLAKGRLLGDEFNDFGAGYWLDDVFNRDNKLTYFAPIGVMDPVSGWRDNLIELRDPLQSTTGLLINISEQDREAFDSIGYDVVGGAPGDWQGIRMQQPTHDANMATIIEQEQPDVAAPGSNATPDTAQFLGVLAPNLQSGDDNKRLGFEVHGLLNSPADADIYSFTALAGTEIWLDIDRTSSTLDSVVELIDSNGDVLAGADTSDIGPDSFTTNPRDAGMRLVLPGIAGTESNQLVRVSSNLTSGQYQLQIRLQAGDMVPGTSVQFADIRYAEAGVRIIGPPVHSPLQGDQVEDESPNDVPWERDVELLNDDGGSFDPPKIIAQSAIPFKVAAQDVGNLRATDRAAISISGNLDASSDVDWYKFDVSGPGLAGVVLDIDYAAGLGRANTNLSVFNAAGTLVYFSDQANVAADLPAVLTGGSGTTDLDDLSRGSVSTQDPFIGPVILSGTWYAAVSSNGWVPVDIASGAASLDPIIPGSSGRGEIVSGASGSFIFSPDPAVPLFDVQIGEYQLEIRYVPVPDLGFDANSATAGDKNRERVQSQIIIDSNSIRDSLEWGIVVEDSLRDMPFDFSFSRESLDDAPPFVREFNRQPHQQFTNADFVPHGAPPRALPVLDEERIVPGLTFKNNVITGGVEGGIQMQGDPDGFMLTTYNLKQLVDMIPDFSQGNIENTEFTIWDHQRKSVTFEFTSSGTTKHPGNVPLRFDLNEGNDDLVITGDFKWVNPPTIAAAVASEIEDAIRRTDLDVKVYRPNFLSFSGFAGEFGFFGPTTPNDNVLFIEGAIEIGHPDIWNASHEDVFNPDKSFLPIISAEVVQQGAVPFARIVNNTVVGRGGDLFATPGAGDIGILVEDNASPTILNNIIANFDTGYQTDLTSTDQPIDRRTFLSRFPINQFDFDLAELEALIAQAAPGEFGGFVGPFGASIRESLFNDGDLNPAGLQITEQGIFGSLQRTGSFFPWARDIDADPTDYAAPRPSVMGAAVYQGNLANSQQVGIGDFAIALSNTDPLFVDPASGNFLLADNSRAIDSSIERLGERDRLKAIKAPIGIAPSDVLAPDLDTRGQLRVDDPSVEPPAGFGDNVFKDRGALDRVDFVGPAVVLVNPADNDLAGFDRNPGSTEVLLIGASLTDFSIQLVDRVGAADPAQGVGID
ncbi:MAG: NF038122 family metalloprotease, partial [Pirellulales bacterium]